MNNVKNALSRKWGPLPAWAWFVGLFFVLYFYRRMKGNASVSGTGTGSVAPASGPPQAQQTLEPGQSVYDPNTGALLTAPGNPSDAQAATDLGAAMDALANAIATGMPPTQVNVTAPKPATTEKHTSGAKKTNEKTTHNMRRIKPKIKGKIKVRKPSNPAHKTTGRSHANIVSPNGGRTKPRQTGSTGYAAPAHGQHPAQGGTAGQPSKNGAPSPSRARQRPRIAPVTTVLRQRRPAQTPRPSPKSVPGPAPRPSAPAPRTQRTPTKGQRTPASRRRK